MAKKLPIKEMLDDVSKYPGPDNRGLHGVHYKGAIFGYSHGGHRVRKVFFPGMDPRVACPEIPGVTRTWNVVPPNVIEKERREFERWVSWMEWYERGTRVMVTDDYRSGRIEYRIVLP